MLKFFKDCLGITSLEEKLAWKDREIKLLSLAQEKTLRAILELPGIHPASRKVLQRALTNVSSLAQLGSMWVCEPTDSLS